jgi:hypothetical protein
MVDPECSSKEFYLDSRKDTGFVLALDGQVVHLSVLDRPKNGREKP